MQYLELLRRYPRHVGYGLLHYFFSSPGQTFFISLYVGYFTLALGIDTLEFDGFYSMATLASGLTLPWIGGLIDRIKLRYFSLGLGVVFLGFCGLAASVSTVWMLVLALYGLRLCGQGLMGLTASTATARFFTGTRGQALSLVSFGVSFGEILLPPLFAGYILKTMSWQASWLVVAGMVLLIFIPLALGLVKSHDPFHYNQEARNSSVDTDTTNVSRAQVLRRPSFYIMTLCFMVPPFLLTGIIINKGLLGAANGWSEEMLAWGLSAFGITRLIANLVSGPLIDRFSAVRVFSFMLVPQIIGVLLMSLSDLPIAMYAFFIFSGISASLNSIASTAAWAELYGTRYLGAIRSMVSTFMVLATAVAPLVLGWALEDPESEGLTLGVSALIMGVVTLATFLQTRRLRTS